MARLQNDQEIAIAEVFPADGGIMTGEKGQRNDFMTRIEENFGVSEAQNGRWVCRVAVVSRGPL
jgi:hypothetical protein